MNLVQQIHNEIDAAQDLIYNEACEVIAANRVEDMDKIRLMKKLGFVNSETVSDAAEKLEKQVTSEKTAKLVMHYKTAYPFLKFLTIGKMNEICEKYELIYAPVGNYIKDVPRKNLNEIANAQALKEEDVQPTMYHVTKVRGEADWQRFLNLIGKEEPIFTRQDVTDLELKYRGYDAKDWTFGGGSENMLFYDAKSALGVKFNIEEYETVIREGLFIAAPKTHFDLKGLDKKGKFGWLKTITTTVPKDPIVFRYVNGGLQVLSKWGLEGEDQALVRPNLN